MTTTIPLSEVKRCFKETLNRVLALVLGALALMVMIAVLAKFSAQNVQSTTESVFFGTFLGWFISTLVLYAFLKENFEEFLES